ncbi:uncharacterized protein DSM5745_03232 [Aspergillus mulundensis]|uniref:Uncharacterized protein n=1 Tax=Aspergillus mulundensis TaxID=1810919 RepID=A0A3D8SJU3_9EURO|nr:Uncharacterized protein DSM5745_03232 [Aspergillus mulundensis]RDW86590.1 Uncharacterized protein DSM5745_03232 [Aspergillus mulundensis]
MTLNAPDSGKQSPRMDLLDPSFVAAVPSQPAKSIEEAEHAFARLEPFHPSSMDLPLGIQNHDSSPGAQMPNGSIPPAHAPNGSPPSSSANVYQPPILADWYPAYMECVRHFLNQAQHSAPVQSLAAYMNIRLPYQRANPIAHFDANLTENGQSCAQSSLRHYIRRLVATGNDTPGMLEAFFGPDWAPGVGGIAKQERLNYLFTAKSAGYAATKAAYDVLPDEQAPFLRPIRDATEEEIAMAEKCWSEWMAMEDWMVGPRSPW